MPGPGSLQEAFVIGVSLHQSLEGLLDPLLRRRRLQDSILDLDHAALGARNGALDDHDAQVVVDLEHRQILSRRRLTSHTSRHLLARVDPGTTTLRGTNGTARAVVERVTVRLVLTAEAVPLHATFETHTAAGASHVDPLPNVEPIRLELDADGQQALLAADAELGDVLLGLDALGLKVAQLGGEGGGGPLGDGADLDGKVAGVLAGLVEQDLDRIQLQDGAGDAGAAAAEEGRHALLDGDDAGAHGRRVLLALEGGRGPGRGCGQAGRHLVEPRRLGAALREGVAPAILDTAGRRSGQQEV